MAERVRWRHGNPEEREEARGAMHKKLLDWDRKLFATSDSPTGNGLLHEYIHMVVRFSNFQGAKWPTRWQHESRYTPMQM
jgi:hypothetical protein